jgi:hypothetical protein
LLLHLAFFACRYAKTEAQHHGAPYRSISVNFTLFDSLFPQEYRYVLIISPFSIDERSTILGLIH